MKIVSAIAALLLASNAFAADLSNVEGHFDATEVTAQHKIYTDYGGRIDQFIEKYEEIADKKAKVEILGTCISACTLVLGTVPREDICVGPNARWAFHSASIGGFGFSSEGTRLIWNIYPEDVREKLREKGWDGEDPEKAEHPNLIYFKGTDFARPCKVDGNQVFEDQLKAVEEVFGKRQ